VQTSTHSMPRRSPSGSHPGDAPALYQLLPPLTDAEYAALRDDIAECGVLVPVEVDENGAILDGHHRVRAATELGLTYPTVVRSGLSERAKRDHARRLNLARRHLSQEQRRTIIADLLAEDPTVSDRAVARLVGCSHHTVAAVRRGGQSAHPDTSTRQATREEAEAGTQRIREQLAALHWLRLQHRPPLHELPEDIKDALIAGELQQHRASFEDAGMPPEVIATTLDVLVAPLSAAMYDEPYGRRP